MGLVSAIVICLFVVTSAKVESDVSLNTSNGADGITNDILRSDLSEQDPVTWPYGTYTLPMPRAGCPTKHFYWQTGSRYQDNGKVIPYNDWSSPCHLQGPYTLVNVEQNFCSKTDEAVDVHHRAWPPGAYCIYKKGDACPAGFDEGWLLWDDTDQLNSNRVTGEVPEGVYDDDTLIYFCCREDGSTTTPVTLPTGDNFMLLMKADTCQEVAGMEVSAEWFRWDSEENLSRVRDYTGGSTPYNTGEKADHLLHYCYYYTGAMD